MFNDRWHGSPVGSKIEIKDLFYFKTNIYMIEDRKMTVYICIAAMETPEACSWSLIRQEACVKEEKNLMGFNKSQEV